jgi:hypothetical protein
VPQELRVVEAVAQDLRAIAALTPVKRLASALH